MLVIAACSPFVRRFLATYEQLVQGAFSQAASLLAGYHDEQQHEHPPAVEPKGVFKHQSTSRCSSSAAVRQLSCKLSHTYR
jgi:hypothetical protein